jgi:predicted signal transduction protein with EAL and GGDEF domain
MARIAAQLIEALSASYKLSGYDVAGGASLGITFYPIDAMTPEELLKNADVAMYRAKECGRNNFQFFTGDMAAGLAENMRIENGLRRAMEAGELSLSLPAAIHPGWPHAGRGSFDALAFRRARPGAAGRFIAVAEKSGMITELGEFALREACASVHNGVIASAELSCGGQPLRRTVQA